MSEIKYIGMDVHQTRTSIVVLNAAGREVNTALGRDPGASLVAFIQGLRGTLPADL